MANVQQKKSEALAIIDAALAILEKFPDLNNVNRSLSIDLSRNPFPFLLECFKNTQGYNVVLKIISKFLMCALPALEVTVKTVLLANLKNILSCSINPFISDELLREGIVFDLKQIDITDILRYSPTDKVGRYYYFDNIIAEKGKVEKDENGKAIRNKDTNKKERYKETVFKTAEGLKTSKDFNCLIWYTKTQSVSRDVWHKKPLKEGESGIMDGEDDTKYWNGKKGKCKKAAGIVTLEYNARSESLKNSEGNGMTIQTPLTDCLHVFIGNVEPRTDKEVQTAQTKYNEKVKELEKLDENIKDMNDNLDKLIVQREDYKSELKFYKDQEKRKHFKTEIDAVKEKIDNTNSSIRDGKKELKKLGKEKASCIKDLRKAQAKTNKYRSIKENYYYRRTLAEFNVDYIMSLKLFDARVVTAQLLDTLLGVLTIDSIDLGINYKLQLIKDEVQKMVAMIVETDDTEVSDCFFTFTNDDYTRMFEKAELNRANLFSVDGEESNGIQIDAAQLLESLNAIDDDAIQSGDTSVIEHALMEVSGTITNTSYSLNDSIGVQIFNPYAALFDNILNKLACVLVYTVLSPKVYLLILINLQTLGKDTNFNLESFIGQFKNLIVSLIRAVRDMLLKYLVNELMKILGDIATEIAVKIGVEQMEYYMRLMKRIFDCFRKYRREYDWEMDKINYADIVSEEITEKANAEC